LNVSLKNFKNNMEKYFLNVSVENKVYTFEGSLKSTLRRCKFYEHKRINKIEPIGSEVVSVYSFVNKHPEDFTVLDIDGKICGAEFLPKDALVSQNTGVVVYPTGFFGFQLTLKPKIEKAFDSLLSQKNEIPILY